MYKFVAYSCLAAAVAYAAPSPDADADAHYGGYGLAHVGVAPAVHTVTTPKCTVTFEEIETQNCVPKTEKVCDTKDVVQESVTFEKECKEVTSKVCGGPHGLVHPHIIKREAEAEAEAWGPAGLYGHAVGAPLDNVWVDQSMWTSTDLGSDLLALLLESHRLLHDILGVAHLLSLRNTVLSLNFLKSDGALRSGHGVNSRGHSNMSKAVASVMGVGIGVRGRGSIGHSGGKARIGDKLVHGDLDVC